MVEHAPYAAAVESCCSLGFSPRARAPLDDCRLTIKLKPEILISVSDIHVISAASNNGPPAVKKKQAQTVYLKEIFLRDYFYWALFWDRGTQSWSRWMDKARTTSHCQSIQKAHISTWPLHDDDHYGVTRCETWKDPARPTSTTSVCLSNDWLTESRVERRTAASNWSSHSQDFWFQTLQIIECATSSLALSSSDIDRISKMLMNNFPRRSGLFTVQLIWISGTHYLFKLGEQLLKTHCGIVGLME